ncbi:MAG: hypothetical protein ACFN3H_05080, partial [Spirochaetales bacterium]
MAWFSVEFEDRWIDCPCKFAICYIAIYSVAEMMGNSTKRLDAPNIGTIFIGIIIGILFGSIPIAIPGMPV